MDGKKRNVVFANKELGQDCRRLATSTHPEDRKSYQALQDIRMQLQMKYLSGSEIPESKIPNVYRRLFHVSNLWSLNLPPHGRVLYSLVEDEIRIVDIV